MPRTIISDTSCFILLTNIGELDLLQKVYSQVVTTVDIATEFGEPLPEWVEILSVKNTARQEILELQLDKGESSAIALALETPDSLIILDDYKARKIAQQLNITFTGTLGVIIKAKLSGLIPSIKPFLRKIRETNFRLSEDIERRVLKDANE